MLQASPRTNSVIQNLEIEVSKLAEASDQYASLADCIADKLDSRNLSQVKIRIEVISKFLKKRGAGNFVVRRLSDNQSQQFNVLHDNLYAKGLGAIPDGDSLVFVKLSEIPTLNLN